MSTCLYISTCLQSGRGQNCTALAQSRNRHLSQTKRVSYRNVACSQRFARVLFFARSPAKQAIRFPIYPAPKSRQHSVCEGCVTVCAQRLSTTSAHKRARHASRVDKAGFIHPAAAGMGAGAAERWQRGAGACPPVAPCCSCRVASEFPATRTLQHDKGTTPMRTAMELEECMNYVTYPQAEASTQGMVRQLT